MINPKEIKLVTHAMIRHTNEQDSDKTMSNLLVESAKWDDVIVNRKDHTVHFINL